MFQNKTEKREEEELSNSSNIVGKGTLLKGDVETFGNIRIEGRLIGNAKTKSKVALGQSSFVEGNILAQNAEIAGEVNGVVEVTDILVLKPSAVVHGDIIANKLVVEPGAVFNGSCKMGGQVKEIQIGNHVNGNHQNGLSNGIQKPKQETAKSA